MTDRKHSFSDMVQQTSNSFAEATDHPLRQAKEMFGGEEAERWTVHQVQFTESARMAGRRALWYLRLVEKDSEEPLLRHVQAMTREQLTPVYVPRKKDELCQPDAKEKCEYSGAIEPRFADLVKMWDDQIAVLKSSTTLTAAELDSVERHLERFVKRSRPLDPFIRFTYSFAPAIRAGLVQHLGIILTFVTGFAVCAGVEAVRSILLNDMWLTGVALVAALAPITILWLVQTFVYHRRGKAAPWNLGGRVVHSWPVCIQPERFLTWHPEGYLPRILLSLGAKTGLHIVLWTLFGILLKSLFIDALGFDGIWLTVYLIVLLWAFVVLIGGVLDFVDMHSRSPIRAMLVAGAAFISIVMVLTDSGASTAMAVAFWAFIMSFWSIRVVKSIKGSSVPAVIAFIAFYVMAVVSDRQRDDTWRPPKAAPAARPLQASEWPIGDKSSGPVIVLAASGGGSRAAIFAAKTLSALETSAPDIAGNLQAISSVSGGSLANAAYVARRLRAAGVIRDSVPQCTEPLTAAMSRDFIQPTIMGLVRRGGRGKAIQNDWEQCPVGLGSASIEKLATAWREAKARNAAKPPFPVPLFNSTTLERNDVVLTPLDGSMFRSVFDAEARDLDSSKYRRIKPATWVFYRSGIYHLDDLLGTMNAPLSSAVRASANFPFGFPLVEVASQKKLWYSVSMADTATPDTVPRFVRLTDGGALSNSGMWPLVPLLVNQREAIGRNRGVMMIVVDASHLPGAPWVDRQRGLMATLMDKNPLGERLHYQMIEELEQQFGDCFGYAYIGIEPQPKFNVYTTWALDRGSLRIVDSAFASAWTTAEPQIRQEYDRLKTCDNSRDVPRRPRIRPTRVPLS